MKKILLLIACALPLLATAEAKKRPNILYIIADDQSPFDLKIYNPGSALQTPNLDRLAEGGMVFDGAYQMGSWVGGVCTASRHMIMSGRTVWHIPDRGRRKLNPNVRDPKLMDAGMQRHGDEERQAAVDQDPPDGVRADESVVGVGGAHQSSISPKAQA